MPKWLRIASGENAKSVLDSEIHVSNCASRQVGGASGSRSLHFRSQKRNRLGPLAIRNDAAMRNRFEVKFNK